MVEVGIDTLSQLYPGSHPLETLELVGPLSVHDDRARAPLESLFPVRRINLSEGF